MPVPEISEDADQARAEIGDIKERLTEQVNISDKFIEDAIADIKNAKIEVDLAAIAVKSFSDRKQFLKSEYADDVISRDNWYKWIFRIHHDVDQARNNDPKYIQYTHAIDSYIIFMQLPPEQQQVLKQQSLKQREQERRETMKRLQSQSDYPGSPKSRIPILSPAPRKTTPPKPSEEEEEFEDAPGATGSGLISCPDNVLADVDRLEIFIGGKRAGNNSSEIINEAADICKRLFSGGVMDVDVYRSLINEIADDYHSN